MWSFARGRGRFALATAGCLLIASTSPATADVETAPSGPGATGEPGDPRDRGERDALEQRAAKVLEDLRYEEAFPLYEQLERTGANDLGQTQMVYRRLAEIAASVRQTELAASRYQKLLAIAPTYLLEPGAPEVFREALELARARLGPLAPLEAAVVIGADRELSVVISRDALHLVGGAVAYRDGDTTPIARAKGAGTIRLPMPAMPPTKVRVIIEDSFGNQLVALPPIDVVARPASSPSGRVGRSWVRRPAVWLGVASGVAAGIGVALGSTIDDRQATLDAILADSRNHTREQAATALDNLERRALHANVGFIAAGVLGTAAVVAFLLESDPEPRDRPALTISRQDNETVVGLAGSF